MALLDPILGPLLNLNPLLAISLLSFILAAISILVNKYFTNQKMLKEHKITMKALQKQAKGVKDPATLMKLQGKMMELNTLIMKESFKPMLITIIPFLLVFAWLNANFTYLPISPDEPFVISAKIEGIGLANINVIPENKIVYLVEQNQEIVNNNVNWTLKGEEGIYTIRFSYNNQSVDQNLIIGESYETPVKSHQGLIKRTTIENKPLKVNFLGLNMKWIWAYIILSIGFSLILRKVLKVA